MLYDVTYSKNILNPGRVYSETLAEMASDVWASSVINAESKDEVHDALVLALGDSKLNYILSIEEIEQ